MSDTWTQISGYSPQDYTDTLTYKVHSSTMLTRVTALEG